MISSATLHAFVVLHVIAISQRASIITTHNKRTRTNNTTRCLNLQAILDHTRIGNCVQHERRVAELAFTSFVNTSVFFKPTTIIGIEVVSWCTIWTDSIRVIGLAVRISNHTLAVEQSIASLAGCALIASKIHTVNINTNADPIGKSVPTATSRTAISIVFITVVDYTGIVWKTEGGVAGQATSQRVASTSEDEARVRWCIESEGSEAAGTNCTSVDTSRLSQDALTGK